MSSLYEDLVAATDAERRGIGAQLISGMALGTDPNINQAFRGFCDTVIGTAEPQAPRPRLPLPIGEFGARASTQLVNAVPRVRAFLGAIARSPRPESVIDAGCGSSAILAVGAAVLHPGSQVYAYEINPFAAECAQRVVGLLGLTDWITVYVEDVTAIQLPRVNLGVTETFSPGLLQERGVKIAEVLAGCSDRIIPNSIDIQAIDIRASGGVDWQRATTLDLRRDNTVITGSFTSTYTGRRAVSIHAAYFDADGAPMLTHPGHSHPNGDDITRAITLGMVHVNHAGDLIHFSYQPGFDLEAHPAHLWTTTQ